MTNVRVLRTVCLGAALFCFSGAQAHSPYLLPNLFDVGKRDHVTAQGSFTEEFFEPDVAMKSDDPLAGHAVSLYAGQARYSDKKAIAEVTTDKAGRFSFKPEKAGVYLAMSRHRPTPAKDTSQGVSYTYSVVIEATQ